ncbi:flagellar brake protein [Cupriavidus sp. CuC1]|uniref:flagellar brake protein n=1 Tax=Cupriavidus sp. CuC1 TaxID=3373131 RepID=UPI0037D2F1F6
MHTFDPASIRPPSPDGFQHALEDEIREMLDVLATQERYLDLRLPDGRTLRSRVLFVDAAARLFTLEGCESEPDNQAILASAQSELSTVLDDVSVTLALGAPQRCVFAGAPAFAVPFPQRLSQVQRRRDYRAETLDFKYTFKTGLPDGSALILDIADLSTSGVGLRSRAPDATALAVGTVLPKGILSFGTLARLEVGVRVVRYQLVNTGADVVHHYGCEFVAFDQAALLA